MLPGGLFGKAGEVDPGRGREAARNRRDGIISQTPKDDGNQVTMVLLIHGEMELTVDLTFDGDRVSGFWRTDSMDGKLTGARAKDPGPGAEA